MGLNVDLVHIQNRNCASIVVMTIFGSNKKVLKERQVIPVGLYPRCGQ